MLNTKKFSGISTIELDEFGRAILPEELRKLVTGGHLDLEHHPHPHDKGCGIDFACSDTPCSDASCKSKT